MKSYLKKLIYPVILAIILWAVLFFTRKGQTYYVLDSIWVTGLILLLQALLFYVSNEGVFYLIGWGFKKMVDLIRVTPKMTLKYFEYVEEKRSGPKADVWPSLLVGGVLFIVGLIWWMIIR